MRSPYKTPTRAAQTDIVFSPVKSGKKRCVTMLLRDSFEDINMTYRWSVELDENNDTNNASDIAGLSFCT